MSQSLLIDTHAHLTFSDYDQDREAVIQRAQEAGVSYLVNIGAGDGLAGNQRALDLAQKHDTIWATIGAHPHEAKEWSVDYFQAIQNLATQDKVVAIGEIGLDYHYGQDTKKEQEVALRQQIQLAHTLNLPIVIHCREAEEDMERILREESADKIGGILHCFTGTLAFAETMIQENFYVSFSGVITFRKKVDDLWAIVKALPLEKILVETDCPYLSPIPYRGKRNEPSYVRHVAEKVAELKNLSFEEVAIATTRNAAQIYRLNLGDTKDNRPDS
jgi:TatD DNase family protein